MMQKPKKKEKPVELSDIDQIKAEFEQEKKNVIKNPATRKVTVKYKSCCGCGCADVKLEREVPWDSPLQNGDKVTEWLDTDKRL